MILDQEVGKWRSAAAVWVAPDGSAIKTEETNYGHCDQPLKQKKQITDLFVIGR